MQAQRHSAVLDTFRVVKHMGGLPRFNQVLLLSAVSDCAQTDSQQLLNHGIQGNCLQADQT